MAKDSSKGTGAGGGGSVSNLQIGDDKIDLSESPLVYGQKDAALTGKARQTVEEFENRRVKNKIEYGVMTDADGNVIGREVRGGKGSVRMSISWWMRNTVMSHIHPREGGILGGTFSPKDVDNFVKYADGYSHRTTRAAAKEGTYSISKGSKFDGSKLKAAYRKAHDEAHAKAAKRIQQVGEDYAWGKITYSQMKSMQNKINNTMLVEQHNWLLANQKAYGYTYTLERR